MTNKIEKKGLNIVFLLNITTLVFKFLHNSLKIIDMSNNNNNKNKNYNNMPFITNYFANK